MLAESGQGTSISIARSATETLIATGPLAHDQAPLFYRIDTLHQIKLVPMIPMKMRETSEAVNNDRIPAVASDLQPEAAGLRATVDAVRYIDGYAAIT